MYIKSSYVQIVCLVSYMLKLFFQKNNHEYMQVETKIKMYSVECVLYLVQYLSNKRRVNVLHLRGGFVES